MRRAHKLQARKVTSGATDFVFVDTETSNEEGKQDVGFHTLDFGVCKRVSFSTSDSIRTIYERRSNFTKASAFWDFVIDGLRSKNTVWVLAHNWNFDGAILETHTEMRKRGFDLKLYINEKPPVIIKWQDTRKRTIIQIDTLNYFTASVAAIGTSVGLPKLDMPSSGASHKEWQRYAWRDLEIIEAAFLALRQFIIENDLGKLQFTLASQAFNSFQHSFLPNTDIYVHDRKRFLTLERAAYHGGRTEAFYRGEVRNTLYKLDVNSFYPSIMRDEELPYEPLKYYDQKWDNTDADFLRQLVADKQAVVAEVKLDTDREAYPVFYEGKLVFPVGNFDTILTTPEIEYALEHNHIKRVTIALTYNRAILFRRFVDFFYKTRQEHKVGGRGAFEYMCKILMNSLYGKFGQSGKKWKSFSDLPEGIIFWQETEDSPIYQIRHILGQTQRLEIEPESQNSIPNIAAEITAYARIGLWRFIDKVREAEGNVFYCDTDSLIVDSKGYEALLGDTHETALGKLKLEGIAEYGHFLAPKHYQFGDEIKIKGVKKSSLQSIDSGSFTQELFHSWDALIKRNSVDGGIPIERITKRVSGWNTKRQVKGENQWTLPIRLGDGVAQ